MNPPRMVASRLDDGVRRVEVGLARGETDDGKAALLHRSREVGERHRLGLAEGRDARVQGLVHLGADHHRGAAGARRAAGVRDETRRGDPRGRARARRRRRRETTRATWRERDGRSETNEGVKRRARRTPG